MQIRRLVTGHTTAGKATVASDTKVEAITVDLVPGWKFFNLWGADEPVAFPDDGSSRPYSTYFPPLGGFRFGLFTVAPQSVTTPDDLDLENALAEMEKKLPGMVGHMEHDNPGMHTTDSIDFVYVISGEVWLELDDSEEIHLSAGDAVVQNGTRHAWRNKSSDPCRMLFCLIGANRR